MPPASCMRRGRGVGEEVEAGGVDGGERGIAALLSVGIGGDGNGGEHARAITRVVPNLQDAQLTTIVREGLPARGMPANRSAVRCS